MTRPSRSRWKSAARPVRVDLEVARLQARVLGRARHQVDQPALDRRYVAGIGKVDGLGPAQVGQPADRAAREGAHPDTHAHTGEHVEQRVALGPRLLVQGRAEHRGRERLQEAFGALGDRVRRRTLDRRALGHPAQGDEHSLAGRSGNLGRSGGALDQLAAEARRRSRDHRVDHAERDVHAELVGAVGGALHRHLRRDPGGGPEQRRHARDERGAGEGTHPAGRHGDHHGDDDGDGHRDDLGRELGALVDQEPVRLDPAREPLRALVQLCLRPDLARVVVLEVLGLLDRLGGCLEPFESLLQHQVLVVLDRLHAAERVDVRRLAAGAPLEVELRLGLLDHHGRVLRLAAVLVVHEQVVLQAAGRLVVDQVLDRPGRAGLLLPHGSAACPGRPWSSASSGRA